MPFELGWGLGGCVVEEVAAAGEGGGDLER